MKKILTMILLAMLIAFTGCDSSGGSSNSDSEDATNLAVEIASGIAKSYSSVPASGVSASGVSSGTQTYTIPTTSIDGMTISGSIVYDDVTYDISSGTLTIAFTNMSQEDITLTGSLTYTFSTTAANTISGSMTGTLTVTYSGESYAMVFDLTQTQTSTTIEVTGTVSCNGETVNIDETESI